MENVSEDILKIITKISLLSIDDISLDSNLLELMDGNVYKMGLILYGIQEFLGQNFYIDEERFYQGEKTVKEILDYFKLY